MSDFDFIAMFLSFLFQLFLCLYSYMIGPASLSLSMMRNTKDVSPHLPQAMVSMLPNNKFIPNITDIDVDRSR